MTVESLVVGGTTPTSARVTAKVGGTNATLLVADNPGMSGPVELGPVQTDARGVAHLTATGLDPDTRYWYAVADEEGADLDQVGTFLTHPPRGEPADFTFWFATCAGSSPEAPGVGDVLAPNRLSNHPVFELLRQRALNENWLLGVHGGDLHYYDIGSLLHGITDPSIDTYRRAYDDVLAQPNQAGLYRGLSHVYLWDDHDFGPNNSDRTHTLRDAAGQVYRERWPHYPLGASSGSIFQHFYVGRVLFIGADVRYDRDPNGDPQDPDKTMLGTQQRAWMEALLSTADAEFLVWLQPDQWTRPSGTDNWSNYQHERDQLVELLGDTGWLGRMLMLQGDRHQVNMDSGANNPFGGFPVYELAPLDSSPSNGANSTSWDVGRHATAVDGGNQRGQYATIRIQDLGGEIQVTGRSHVMSQGVLEHVFSVPVSPPPAPPAPPAPAPPVTVPEIRTKVTWLSCDLATGRLITELPDLSTDSLERVIGAYTSTRLELPIPKVGNDRMTLEQKARLAQRATEPAATMLVAVVNAIPMWAGIPLHLAGGTPAALDIASVSLDGYLQYRYVQDHAWEQEDVVSVIATGLFEDANAPVEGVGSGIGLVIDAPPSGVLADREYVDGDDQPVYDALRELDQAGLLEWTIDLDWADDTRLALVKIARVRPRLGLRAAPPPAVFRTAFSSRSAADATYVQRRDHTSGRYANVTRARGAGQGEDQPRSAPAIDTAALEAGRPIWEHRFRPEGEVVEQDELDRHANAELARLRGGAVTYTVLARWDQWPRYGVDWRLGDDVAAALHGHLHPGGLHLAGRAIGFRMDIKQGTIQPILREPVVI